MMYESRFGEMNLKRLIFFGHGSVGKNYPNMANFSLTSPQMACRNCYHIITTNTQHNAWSRTGEGCHIDSDSFRKKPMLYGSMEVLCLFAAFFDGISYAFHRLHQERRSLWKEETKSLKL